VATLGIDGKLDASQIPSSLSGAVVFKGVWNAETNTPALSDSTPAGLIAGWEYIVEVGATRDIGDGSKVFVSGDFVIFDGTHWKQVPSGNLFTSLTGGGGITVNQSTGAMILGSSATPNATTSTIVSRDSSGNFAANVITANLTGVVTGSVSGNAGSVTNGVYTTGGQTIDGTKTFTSTIQGTVTTATNAGYAYSFNTGTLVANAVNAQVATTTTNFNTGTLVANAVNAQVATTTTNFNTGTLVTQAVTAGTVTTAAQPAITSVGTLTNLSIAGHSSAKHHTSTPVELGTTAANFNLDLSAGELQRVTVTADVTITVQNPAAGRTTRLVIVYSGNRTVTHGIAAAFTNTKATTQSGNNQIHILEFYQFGATLATDVYLGIM
jgi:hypothetical protein